MSNNKNTRKAAHAAKEKKQARKVLFGLVAVMLILGFMGMLVAGLL